MTKEETISKLNELEKSVKELKKSIMKLNTVQIKQKEIKQTATSISRKWFEEIEKDISFYDLPAETIKKYHGLFDTLLKLAHADSRKNRYNKTLQEILVNFREEMLITVTKHAGEISKIGQLDAIQDSVTEEEKNLMKEAIDCAKSGFLRASVVLGWATTIYRMHKMVEKMGFDTFNKKSEEMKKIEEGRYKRFTKYFHVHNIAELQATVFDNDLLWVLEYCGLIDYNQHERLTTCFVMRNTCAHPSSTKITEENLISFYSDLKTIIFDNKKFRL